MQKVTVSARRAPYPPPISVATKASTNQRRRLKAAARSKQSPRRFDAEIGPNPRRRQTGGGPVKTGRGHSRGAAEKGASESFEDRRLQKQGRRQDRLGGVGRHCQTGLPEARRGAEAGLAPRASGRKERLLSAPRRLWPDPDLVPRGTAAPARWRLGSRCLVTCGFERTSDGLVFSY